jgi:hypothetical protein
MFSFSELATVNQLREEDKRKYWVERLFESMFVYIPYKYVHLVKIRDTWRGDGEHGAKTTAHFYLQH